jgi:serine/threonine-protein kinase
VTIEPGQTLLHYRLVEKIGEGGMGVVWKAVDGKLDREVAIKLLPAELSQDAERLGRFEREAKLLASLNQRNIAAVHGIERAGETHFIVMELIDGADLAERLKRGPLTVDETIDVCRQIARALEVAHDGGVIHRDLKPANVKIDSEGRVKVLDFGLAKAFEPDPASGQANPSLSPTLTSAGTRAGMILGTAAYMSPEQARGRSVDKRSDVWSFGCVLFECLTGRQAFAGDTVTDTLASILKVEPDWSLLPANTPPRVRELLERCLAKELKGRLRDVGDGRQELERISSAHEVVVDSPSTESVQVPAAPRRHLASAPSLLVAVILGAALGWGFWKLWPVSATTAPGEKLVTRLTLSYPEDLWVIDVELSPTGRLVSMIASPRKPESPDQDFDKLYIQGFDEAEPRPVSGSDRVSTASFSPDGQWLVMLTTPDPESSSSRLFKVPVDGSAPPLALLDWPDGFWTPVLWLPDGDLLVRTENREIVRIPSDGGPPRAPVKIRAEGFEGNFGFDNEQLGLLPGGKHLLGTVSSFDESGWHQNLAVLDIDTGEAKVILTDGNSPDWSETGHVLFGRGPTLLAVPFDTGSLTTTGGVVAISDGLRINSSATHGEFSLARNGTMTHAPGGLVGTQRQYVRVDADIEELGPWSDDLRPFVAGQLRISANGRRLAVVVLGADGLYSIWISRVDRPSLRLFVAEEGHDCTPDLWTPDGEQLIYGCNDVEVERTYLRAADGSDEPQLLLEDTAQNESYSPDTTTPDGSTLVLTHWKGAAGRDLVLLPLGKAPEGTPTPELLLADAASGKISPDGRWLVYQSETTGRWEVYLRSLSKDRALGPEIRVSTDGGGGPMWFVPENGGPPEIWFGSTGGMYKVRLTTEPEMRVSKPTIVSEFQEKREIINERYLSGGRLPDGGWIGLRRSEDEAEPTGTSVVLNWTTELKRRLGH